MTPTGTPYIHAADLTGAWVKLTLRRELSDHPVATHVIASLHTTTGSDPVDTAIAEHLRFDRDQKKQIARFELSGGPSLSLRPIVPIPETDDAPSLDDAESIATFEIELQIIDSKTEQEYDTVILEITGHHGTKTIREIAGI
jgi:hypothetical protein